MTFPLMKDNTISALPVEPKQKRNPAEPGGTDHIYPLEGKAKKQHLESTLETENRASSGRIIMGAEVQEPPARAQPCEGSGERTCS